MLLYAVDVVKQSVFEIIFPPASAGGDHIKWRGSASNPPGAALQEEGGSGESGQPGICPREAGRALKEQETHQILQKGQRQTRPQAKGQSKKVHKTFGLDTKLFSEPEFWKYKRVFKASQNPFTYYLFLELSSTSHGRAPVKTTQV